MNSWLQNLSEQIRALPPGRQLALALSGAGSLAFFLWLAFGAVTVEYRGLYRGLAEDEVGSLAEALRAEGIDYQLADGGTSILVPAAQVYEARIRMASQGLPRRGASGFEIFDRPGFGVTEFVHRVNYLRAVQGELARSVEKLEPVERARVQLVIPERRSVVAARQRKPRASVVVQWWPRASSRS
jgi:flagellar M-ring protein FliF